MAFAYARPYSGLSRLLSFASLPVAATEQTELPPLVWSISDEDPHSLKRENPGFLAGALLALSGEPGFASYASSPRLI